MLKCSCAHKRLILCLIQLVLTVEQHFIFGHCLMRQNRGILLSGSCSLKYGDKAATVAINA